MKHKYLGTLLLGMCLMGITTSCDDFLDRNGEPQSEIIPSAFFKNVADLEAYSINLYSIFPTIEGYGISLWGKDNNTDNQASVGYSNRWVPGQIRVGAGDWDFSFIRSCNYFLVNVGERQKANEIQGDAAVINHYIGEVYLMRAMEYFNKLQDYGDFPIVTELFQDTKEELVAASVRQPRYKVARFILQDLDKAIELLMQNAPHGKNRINKDVAYLLRSRVALFEGTWLKHHRGTAWVPGGPGWQGNSADLEGFDIDNEINYFLTEAMNSAKVVGDKLVDKLVDNTDSKEGMNADLGITNPYYAMFCDENMEKYSEVLMWRQYSVAQGITHNIQMQLEDNGGGSGWTRGLVNSFLMRNGLPFYNSGSGYDPKWEEGTITDMLQKRDSRIQIFTKRDGDVDYYTADGGAKKFSPKWIVQGNNETRMVTGFAIKKGKHYSQVMQNEHGKGTSGSIVFRGTEALLNYMEACVEKNNSVDGIADKYWRALRKRAHVDEDYNATIAATNMTEEAKGDWGAYSAGKLIDAKLYNVRRERRCELIGEGFRWADLKRWRACDQMITTPYIIEGMRYWGSAYEGKLLDEDGKDLVIVSVADGKGNMSAEESSVYIRPYQISKLNNSVFDGYRFQKAYYLSAIGQETFRQTASDPKDLNTSIVYQNPGWPKVAGESATE